MAVKWPHSYGYEKFTVCSQAAPTAHWQEKLYSLMQQLALRLTEFGLEMTVIEPKLNEKASSINIDYTFSLLDSSFAMPARKWRIAAKKKGTTVQPLLLNNSAKASSLMELYFIAEGSAKNATPESLFYNPGVSDGQFYLSCIIAMGRDSVVLLARAHNYFPSKNSYAVLYQNSKFTATYEEALVDWMTDCYSSYNDKKVTMLKQIGSRQIIIPEKVVMVQQISADAGFQAENLYFTPFEQPYALLRYLAEGRTFFTFKMPYLGTKYLAAIEIT